MWTAFVFGCLILVGLIGAAFAGWLPDHLRDGVIRVAIAAAGGGFTLFLFGYFDLHFNQGIKAGGALGVFVLLLLLDPGKKILPPHPPADPEVLINCRNNVVGRQFDYAEDVCERAVAEMNNDYRALTYLGSAQYNRGKIITAIATWEKAIRHGADMTVSKYNMALAYYTGGRYERSAALAAEAARSSNSRSNFLARILFLQASAEVQLWESGRGSNAASHFEKAVQKYQEFIDIGTPKYQAYANLACIYASSAIVGEEANRKTDFENALKYFDSAVSDIVAFNWPGRAKEEKEAFAAEFGPESSSKCSSAIMAAWRQHRPNIDYETRIASIL